MAEENIEDEIDSILNNPVFIDALNVANCVPANDGAQESNDNDIGSNNAPDDTTLQNHIDDDNNTGSDSNSHTVHRTIEKLRIAIPAMASPTTSLHSSSSESHSPVRSKKNKKRFCLKCCMRFKHTADWLEHCKKHVTLPEIKLERLDLDNPYYKAFMERSRSQSKRSRSPNDTESLKIKLKIPRDNMSTFSANSMGDSDPGTPAATPPVQNECRIRVLRAEEIKQSPPRSPLKHILPDHAMVALPSENRVHYECPTLDGLSQFAEEAMNEESTAQILKQLLETPNEPQLESTDWDSTNSNEFISIDRLAHTCKTCNEKYPDLNFLHEHQRLTGHGDRGGFLSPTMLEPIQEMTVDPMQRYHPPQTSQLEQMLQKQPAPHPPPPMYGQPPVLPIHQMENQVRNFGGMGPMVNRPRYPMPPRHPSQMPPNYPMHRNYPMPPAQMMRSNGMQSNQPMNMAPFLEMNPDMYNPQQASNNTNMPMGGFDRPPNQMIHHRLHMQQQQQQQPGMPQPPHRMPQQMPTPQTHEQAMLQRYSMQQQQQQQRPAMNGPLINRPLRNLPPYPMRQHPHMGKPNQMMPPGVQQRPSMMPPMNPLDQQQKARFEQMVRSREIENRPFISNAPPTEGLPRIESVQSGAISLNHAKKSSEPNPTIQISDQITLSLKNKDSSLSVSKTLEKQSTAITAAASSAAAAAVAAAAATAAGPSPSSSLPNDPNKMKTFLANRGITVKSTSKLLEKSKQQIDDTNKTPYSSAEAAVQKLQMNNSVSIISKKVSASPSTSAQSQQPSTSTTPIANKENDTIDLSIDDDTPDQTIRSTPTNTIKLKPRPTILKCPIKRCDMRFSNVRALRDHSLRVHQLARLNKFKCTICSTRFPSTDAVKAHIQKMHPDKVNVKSEFGIPIVNFNDPNIRKKMLSLGFTNFLPVTNVRSEKSELFGMPIININGPSINNLKNLFDTDSAKIMPISSMRTIARPQPPSLTPASASSTLSSLASAAQSSVSATSQPSASTQSIQTSRAVPKLISATSSTISHPVDPLSILQKSRM